MITSEDVELAHDYIYLTYLMDTVRSMGRKAEHHEGALRPLIAETNEALLERVHSDLIKIKQRMRISGLKVQETDGAGPVLRFMLYVGRYQEPIGFMRELVKAELGVLLEKYISIIQEKMSNRVAPKLAPRMPPKL